MTRGVDDTKSLLPGSVSFSVAVATAPFSLQVDSRKVNQFKKQEIQMSNMKHVYMIRKGEKSNFWTRIGVAFVNKDGSLNVRLNAVPIDGQIQIRDPKPETQTETA